MNKRKKKIKKTETEKKGTKIQGKKIGEKVEKT